ncbi:MAG TPA: glutamyl-tRNA reductase [Bacteroidia bacterium]|nr:glutamyl-tRNA reductase [Bacteroidia bacterium]
MQQIHFIAITHRSFRLEEIGKFHLSDDRRGETLLRLKATSGVIELFYLSTCNRVEFLVVTPAPVDRAFAESFFSCLLDDESTAKDAAQRCELYSDAEALRHIFNVAASLDSIVVGEREIITQVRNAYEECTRLGITSDTIRLVVQKAIETAKTVYTQTAIARNPVSVVSLAYRKLRALHVPLDAKFLLVGSGSTNTAMARYLKKHGYQHFVVFNRTLAHAEKLATELDGIAFPLDLLGKYTSGFDVIVTCTGAETAVITPEIYNSLVGSDTARKVVIDLAVPNDLDPAVLTAWDVNLIAVNNLQDIALDNLREREGELAACNEIIDKSINSFRQEFRERQVELAMSEVPKKVKEIRETAMNAVFAKEISQLDESSKEVLDRVLNYVEKKYISVPMKMAKEILTDIPNSNGKH